MSSAFERDASFPVLLAPGDAGSMWAIGVGVAVSSLRKRLKNPPLFFLSLSAAASEAPGCGGGGAHSSARAGGASFESDPCCGAGIAHALAFALGSFGFAVGAQAFAGASLDAGGAVIHDSAGVADGGAALAAAPPPGGVHQSVAFGLASGAGRG